MENISDAVTVGHLIATGGGTLSLLIIAGLLMWFLHMRPQESFRREMYDRVNALEKEQAVMKEKLEGHAEDWKMIVTSVKDISEKVHQLTLDMTEVKAWIRHQKEK